MVRTITLVLGLSLACLLPASVFAQAALALPAAQWRGELSEIEGVPEKHRTTLGYPVNQRSKLTFNQDAIPGGVYLLRMKLRASHVCDEVAWNSGLKVLVNENEAASLDSLFFARANQPEWKSVQVVIPDGPLRLSLAAWADVESFKHQALETKVETNDGPDADPDMGMGEISFGLSSREHQYFALDDAELVPLSRSGYIAGVTTDKIRYMPGDTLKGTATVGTVGKAGAKGTVTLFLEHGVNTRDKVKEIPVILTEKPQTLSFDIPLPKRELGHALVAVYNSADGKDRSEAAEYFNIVTNFYRTAIHGGMVIRFGNSLLSMQRQREVITASRKKYQNCGEMFAWAEEDMVEMSPQTDWWFSGQTCYHLQKEGLKNLIAAAHEQGYSCVTYGKFIMSGYLGWKTAYDYPLDHRGQYHYPVGMWEGVNVKSLDRFKNKEFFPIGFGPHVRGGVLDRPMGWQDFLPINPDATPRMTRIAAEEIIRSVEMFGWDAVRWDGHPRGGGQCGGEGRYDYYAALRTQALVRYFKDIVNAKYPYFQHGYNYYFVQNKPDPSWGIEDFELDELCRGGGLVMNESIRNSAGRPFEWIASNIQVEGDLSRERDGFLLGISCDGESTRDAFVEAILYFAGGMRPMGAVSDNTLINRYGTRYSKYVFDENLRRLAKPEGVLKPAGETNVWWQPFVYETPREGNTAQLVVNLLNIPRQATPKQEQDPHPKWDMNPGTVPFSMGLTLPAGYTAMGAHFINPFTLEVIPAEVKANAVAVPIVDAWLVLVVDLKVADGAPTLASQFGPPRTFGVKRQGLEIERIEPRPLDIGKDTVEVNKDMSFLAPKAKTPAAPEKDLDALGWDARNAALLEMAAKRTPDDLLKGWWKGGSLPHDLKVKDKPPVFPDLTPQRDGAMDIYYGRGAMDYRLRLWEVFAGFDCARIREGKLTGVVRQSAWMALSDGIIWRDFPAYDLVLYTSIPHAAIGAENGYALVDYVKAGGGVLFTGGEYAFGKGGYDFTVLERELLPVQCTETVDVKYAEDTPFLLEPGKDFAELGVKTNFAAKPAFWCYNRVALKPNPAVKVFLKSGNRPILIGWQLGKGRVACLLIDHRGISGDGVNMFFDWADWPALMRAVMRWTAPDAGKVDPPAARPDIPALLKTLAADTATDVSIREVRSDDPDAEPDLGLDGAGMILDEKSLKKRIPLLRELLRGDSAEVGLALAEQAIKIGNLPEDLRQDMLDFARRHRPATGLTAPAEAAIAGTNPAARGVAMQVLGLAGGPAFLKVVKNPPNADVTNEFARDRALACGIVFCPTADLAALGKAKVDAINKVEADRKKYYVGFTGGTDFSLAAPEQPCIDTESFYLRVGWLAYLSRQDPANYGAQFAREWLMVNQYKDYADLTISGIWSDRVMTGPQKQAKVKPLQALQRDLDWLDRVTEPAMEQLLKANPDAVAKGFCAAHFNAEANRAISFLLRYTPAETKAVLAALSGAKHERLVAFGKARLGQ
ncbi:MAG: hypothetical protein BWY76_00073 [bacterium ADurb.Bin429]|nr:MAG: hypothetical protein BWY76_00073 [bacterium ADurb.Bin429]